MSDLVNRLAAHRTIGAVPRAQLGWLAAQGEVRHLAVGSVALPKGAVVTDLWVLLSGCVSIAIDRGEGTRTVMRWRGGDVTGALPYSRVQTTPGAVVANEPTDALVVPKSALTPMIRECPELTTVLVHVMLDRAREFTSNDLLDEKMHALGRLSAALAHELNNPASAAARSASLLLAEIEHLDLTAERLGGLRLDDAQRQAVWEAREAARALPDWPTLERADREDGMQAWLDARSLDEVDAATLASSDITVDGLNRLAAIVPPQALEPVVAYLAAHQTVARLSSEITLATSRIHLLVAAIKGFTYLDHAPWPEPVDVGRGLSDTLRVFGAKARSRSVDLRLELPAELPKVQGFGGALNQVWGNLIDNAIDASPQGGRVLVKASAAADTLVVSVIDCGAGIPDDMRERIFEQFFTTKGIGEGSGLGLDLARRIVRRHDGAIDVQTGPAGTEFRVTLPLTGAASAGAADTH